MPMLVELDRDVTEILQGILPEPCILYPAVISMAIGYNSGGNAGLAGNECADLAYQPCTSYTVIQPPPFTCEGKKLSNVKRLNSDHGPLTYLIVSIIGGSVYFRRPPNYLAFRSHSLAPDALF